MQKQLWYRLFHNATILSLKSATRRPILVKIILWVHSARQLFGPLLFVIYINDVTDALRSDWTCQLFADNLKLCSVANFADNNTLVIQDSLDKLCLWSDLWQLTISHNRRSVMSIGCRINDDNFKGTLARKNTHVFLVRFSIENIK